MTETLGLNAKQTLISFARRIERLDGEMAALSEDRKQVLAEAKSSGFDEKALKKVIKELAMDEDKRGKQLSFELVVDTYRRALDLPTNEQVVAREAKQRSGGGRAGKTASAVQEV
jgi:uncharacterized protein (UPF0335 family)